MGYSSLCADERRILYIVSEFIAQVNACGYFFKDKRNRPSLVTSACVGQHWQTP
jgi:hypothetical protein